MDGTALQSCAALRRVNEYRTAISIVIGRAAADFSALHGKRRLCAKHIDSAAAIPVVEAVDYFPVHHGKLAPVNDAHRATLIALAILNHPVIQDKLRILAYEYAAGNRRPVFTVRDRAAVHVEF